MHKHLWLDIHDSPWKQNIVLASVPLWKYITGIPIANASGCLIDYMGSRFLISIAHASIATSEWHLEINSADKDQNGEWGTTIQPVEMAFLTQLELVPETNDFTQPKIVDFTYRKIPSDTTSYHVLSLVGDSSVLGAYRTIFAPNFEITPNVKKKYGFYGKVKFGGTKDRQILFEDRLEDDLTFIREEGEYYIFKLSHKYGSHANYRGCSGAPIIDEDNNLIALVSYGERSTNCIYAINIKKYRAALELETKPSLNRQLL